MKLRKPVLFSLHRDVVAAYRAKTRMMTRGGKGRVSVSRQIEKLMVRDVGLDNIVKSCKNCGSQTYPALRLASFPCRDCRK